MSTNQRDARLVAVFVLLFGFLGTGIQANASEAIEPPGAPEAVSASPMSRAATIDWDPPNSPGSYPVSAYQVTGTPSGSCLVSAPETSCVVSGLTNGVEYTFAVRALNGAGWGPYSAESSPVTPALQPPAAPVQVVGRWIDGTTVSLMWSSVAGATSFELTRVDESGAAFIDSFPADANAAGAITVVPGSSGRLEVVAVNEDGSSPPTAWSYDVSEFAVAAIPIGAAPGNAAMSSDGQQIYVGGGYAGSDPVRIYSSMDDTVTGTVNVVGNRVDLSANDDTLLVGSYEQSYVVSTLTGEIVTTIASTSQYTALSPDGMTAYLVDGTSLKSFDTRTGVQKDDTTLLLTGAGIEFAPDGSSVVILGRQLPSSVITVFSPDLSHSSRLVVDGYVSQIVFGSDSSLVYAPVYLRGQVITVDVVQDPPVVIRTYAVPANVDGVLPLDGGARLAVGEFFADNGAPHRIIDATTGELTSLGVSVTRGSGIRTGVKLPAVGKFFFPGTVTGVPGGLMYVLRKTPSSVPGDVQVSHAGNVTTVSWTKPTDTLQPEWFAVSINGGQRVCSTPSLSNRTEYSCTFNDLATGVETTAKLMAGDSVGPWQSTSRSFTVPPPSPPGSGGTPAPGPAPSPSPDPDAPDSVPSPVPLVRAPAAGGGVAIVDGREDTQLRVDADRQRGVVRLTGTGYEMSFAGAAESGSSNEVDARGVLQVPSGGSLNFSGSGFSGEQVDVFLDPPVAGAGVMSHVARLMASSSLHVGSLRVDATGVAAGRLAFPPSISAGDHTIQFVGTSASGGTLVVATVIAIAPVSTPTAQVTISGSRGAGKDRRVVTVKGIATDVTAPTARPWIKFPGPRPASMGKARIRINADGTFAWSRALGKKVSVFVTVGDVRSNRITISAR